MMNYEFLTLEKKENFPIAICKCLGEKKDIDVSLQVFCSQVIKIKLAVDWTFLYIYSIKYYPKLDFLNIIYSPLCRLSG